MSYNLKNSPRKKLKRYAREHSVRIELHSSITADNLECACALIDQFAEAARCEKMRIAAEAYCPVHNLKLSLVST